MTVIGDNAIRFLYAVGKILSFEETKNGGIDITYQHDHGIDSIFIEDQELRGLLQSRVCPYYNLQETGNILSVVKSAKGADSYVAVRFRCSL